jgi:hypothetical protein
MLACHGEYIYQEIRHRKVVVMEHSPDDTLAFAQSLVQSLCTAWILFLLQLVLTLIIYELGEEHFALLYSVKQYNICKCISVLAINF